MDRIKNKNLRWRLKKEFTHLPKNSRIVFSSEKTTTLALLSFCTPHHRRITLEIDEMYPFKPPIIHQNDHLYIHTSHDGIMLQAYQDMYKECGCACCKIIFSPDRWSPCFTLEKICDCILSEEEKWYKVAFSHVSILDTVIPKDIQHLISEFL